MTEHGFKRGKNSNEYLGQIMWSFSFSFFSVNGGVGSLDSVGTHYTRSSELGFPGGMYRRDEGGFHSRCGYAAVCGGGEGARGGREGEWVTGNGEREGLCLFYCFCSHYLD